LKELHVSCYIERNLVYAEYNAMKVSYKVLKLKNLSGLYGSLLLLKKFAV
jgi:hypothetical protein